MINLEDKINEKLEAGIIEIIKNELVDLLIDGFVNRKELPPYGPLAFSVNATHVIVKGVKIGVVFYVNDRRSNRDVK